MAWRRCLHIGSLVSLILVLVFSQPIYAQDGGPQTTPEALISLDIWWAAPAYPMDNSGASRILTEQLEEFEQVNPDIDLTIRLKPAQGTGSALEAILTGTTVAPDAMPAMVLLRRDNLERAVQNGVIKTLDDWVPDALRDDLLPNTLVIGEVNQSLYGLPYLLDLQHMIYREDLVDAPPATFADMQEVDGRFLIPALPRSGQRANDLILAQYLQAGGILTDPDGNPTLDEDILIEILRYYEAGIDAEIFSVDLTTYDTISDYWGIFTQNDIPLAMVSSTLFLQQGETMPELAAAPLPTPDGDALVISDAWMWVLVTSNPDEQTAALQLVEWLAQADRYAAFTESFGVLPAQRPALRIWENEGYAQRVLNWASEAQILTRSSYNSDAVSQLQAAFIAVLNGTSSEEAINAALANLQTTGAN